MPKKVDRFYVDKDDRDLYDSVEREGLFEGKNRRDQFLFTMAVGFKNRVARPLKNKETGGFFNFKDLREEDWALIYSVVSFEHGIEVLSEMEKIVEIAQEYAHAGIILLAESIKSPDFGTYWKKFENEIRKYYADLFSS